MSYDLQLNDGDFVIDNDGDVMVIEGYGKLQQDLDRLIYISRGDNKFDPDEGLGIYDLLGKIMPHDVTQMVISKEIYLGMRHVIEQQASQALSQPLSPYEQIAAVDAISFKKLSIKEIAFYKQMTTVHGLQVTFAYNVK